MSEKIKSCGENFGSLKENPKWTESSTIDPPLEFQDKPFNILQDFFINLANKILHKALQEYKKDIIKSRRMKIANQSPQPTSCVPSPFDPETEFSNSPTFLQGTDELVQHCLEETSKETLEVPKLDTLCGNNKTDLKEVDSNLSKLPTAVPESYDFEKNIKNEVFSIIDWQNFEDSDGETRLPLKKRKLFVKNKVEMNEEICYPATPMISIAEVEALHLRKLETNNTRTFKTPAEKKEMPPLPILYNLETEPSPIITDQLNINNYTYNNPTINYHMNNVPVPLINIPCGSYYSLPPILVPFNVSNFEQAKVQQEDEIFMKKENRKQRSQRKSLISFQLSYNFYFQFSIR